MEQNENNNLFTEEHKSIISGGISGVVVCVVVGLIQSHILATPDFVRTQIADAKLELIKEVQQTYATKTEVASLEKQIGEIKVTTDKIYNLIVSRN